MQRSVRWGSILIYPRRQKCGEDFLELPLPLLDRRWGASNVAAGHHEIAGGIEEAEPVRVPAVPVQLSAADDVITVARDAFLGVCVERRHDRAPIAFADLSVEVYAEVRVASREHAADAVDRLVVCRGEGLLERRPRFRVCG